MWEGWRHLLRASLWFSWACQEPWLSHVFLVRCNKKIITFLFQEKSEACTMRVFTFNTNKYLARIHWKSIFSQESIQCACPLDNHSKWEYLKSLSLDSVHTKQLLAWVLGNMPDFLVTTLIFSPLRVWGHYFMNSALSFPEVGMNNFFPFKHY